MWASCLRLGSSGYESKHPLDAHDPEIDPGCIDDGDRNPTARNADPGYMPTGSLGQVHWPFGHSFIDTSIGRFLLAMKSCCGCNVFSYAQVQDQGRSFNSPKYEFVFSESVSMLAMEFCMFVICMGFAKF